MVLAISEILKAGALATALLRPALGGPPPGWASATVTATGTTGIGYGGGTAVGLGTDVSALLLVAAMGFAVIGFFRGMKREFPVLVITALSYLILSGLWTTVSTYMNRFYKLFVFGFLKRGVLAEDPVTIWQSVKDTPPLVPVDAAGGAAIWQIAFFVFAVLLAYGISAWMNRRRPGVSPQFIIPPPLIERLIGMIPAAATGYLVAHFILSRIIPGAYSTLLSPGPGARDVLTRFGPYAAAGVVGLMILYGIRSLGSKKARVYS